MGFSSHCVSGAMPRRFARWMPKLSLWQTGSRISKAADRALSEQLTDWAMKFLPVLDAEQMIRANGEDAARN